MKARHYLLLLTITQAIAVLAMLASLSSCVLMTDAATRVACDLEAGAKTLMKSDKKELEVEHRPLSFPEGIRGDYNILLQAVQSDKLSRTLSVRTDEGERYGTSYHLNFMTVPKELRIHKERREPTYFLLRKTGAPNDDTLRGNREIEIISIR